MDNIVIFGGGLHSRVCIDIIEQEAKYKIVGIIDSMASIGSQIFGYDVIGRQKDIVTLYEEYTIEAGLIAIGDNYDRNFVHEEIVSRIPDFRFINAVHPSASIGRNVRLGQGIALMAGAIVNPECTIEDFCILNTGAQLDHNSFMGEFSHLSPGSITGAKTKIGRFAAITIGVTLIDRISIGENTVVGSGSLVLRDLPDNVLAYGSPARVIRSRQPGEKFLKS